MAQFRYCKECGNGFTAEREDHHYCCANCRAGYEKRMGEFRERFHAEKEREFSQHCEQCGGKFTFNGYANRGGERAPRFCSDSCRSTWHRENKKAFRQARAAGGGGSRKNDTGTGAGSAHQQREREYQRQQQDFNEWFRRQQQQWSNTGNGQQQQQQRRSRSDSNTADPYQILGVTPEMDFDACRKVWLKLVAQYHPDRAGDTPENTERMQNINAAWDRLRMMRGWKDRKR